jgi:hypothetical protein
MKQLKLKGYSFLRIVCINLSFACSIIAAEKAAEDGFGTAWNQCFCHALEAFGQEKFKELGLEDPIEKQRMEIEHKQKLEREAAVARKAEETEKQRLKDRQEAEKREKEEIFAILGSNVIDQYKLLIDKKLWTHGDVLEKVRKFYSTSQKYESVKWPPRNSLSSVEQSMRYHQMGSAQFVQIMMARPGMVQQAHMRSHWERAAPLQWKNGLSTITRDIEDLMKVYLKAHGIAHPRWDEFNKMKDEAKRL